MNKPYFKDLAADDVAGFYAALRRMLVEVCGADIAPDPDGAQTLLSSVEATVDVDLGLEARLGLTLLADLNSNGALDKLLWGRGTITGKVQPYVLAVDDLSEIDPSCMATSFLRYRKGNPWFSLPHTEIGNDTCAVHTIERHVRRKKVELSVAGFPARPAFRTFLFQTLGEMDLGNSMIIISCPPNPDAFDAAFDHLTRTVGHPLSIEGAHYFEGENAFVVAKWGAGYWTFATWILDMAAPHWLDDAMCKSLDFRMPE